MNLKLSKKKNTDYYDIMPIERTDTKYKIIIGERSNGKTYGALKLALSKFFEYGSEIAVIRRWADDVRGKRGAAYFEALASDGVIAALSDGEWTDTYYYGGRWYFSRTEENKRITSDRPFAYAFTLNAMEHDKSASYPRIRTIIFDEFMTRTMYLADEFVLFCNVLSTIIRDRNDVTVYMLGNTVNKYCPYFVEMGLKNVENQQQGTIDIYEYGNSELKVAVEYCKPARKSKPSDCYFAFDNPKLNMITTGSWELDIYPHCPHKLLPKDIVYSYFIIFGTNLLQCDIVERSEGTYTFVHRKTTDIKNPDRDLVFSTDYDPRPNWRRHIERPYDMLGKKIWNFYLKDKVFYQDNEVGEVIRNFLGVRK